MSRPRSGHRAGVHGRGLQRRQRKVAWPKWPPTCPMSEGSDHGASFSQERSAQRHLCGQHGQYGLSGGGVFRRWLAIRRAQPAPSSEGRYRARQRQSPHIRGHDHRAWLARRGSVLAGIARQRAPQLGSHGSIDGSSDVSPWRVYYRTRWRLVHRSNAEC